MPRCTSAQQGEAGASGALPYLLLALTVLFWSGNMVVGRAGREVLPPIAFNFWRWTIALAILLPFAWRELIAARAVIRREWKILVLLAATGVTTFHSAVYTGLSLTQAINGALYFATSPLFFVLLTWLLFGQRITLRQVMGIFLSMLGAAVVIARGDLGALWGLRLAAGDLWLLLAVALWALYSVLLLRRPADLPPFALLGATMAIGLVLLIPLYALELTAGRHVTLGLESALSIGYVSLFASVIAYIFWNRGVREIGPNPAGVMMNLMPVFSAALAVVFLGERLAAYHWLGAALVLAGILLAGRRR
jgi:drug/metabolite transporter (DMT)-like permease